MSFEPYPINSNQAFVAMVVQEASLLSEEESSYLGRTTLQKVLYFLQVCGVPLRYKFDVHHFGPFCAEILHDAEWLTAFQIIEDKSSQPEKYSSYRVTSEAEEALLKSLSDEMESHRPTIKTIVSALVPMGIDELELISTLHYAYRELRASDKREPSKEALIKRFREFKEKRFEQGKIEAACERMSKAHLIALSN